MRTGKKGTNWVQLWKRNAVVAAVALFVCAAVYLNWSYDQQAQAGKTLGQSTMVGGQARTPCSRRRRMPPPGTPPPPPPLRRRRSRAAPAGTTLPPPA